MNVTGKDRAVQTSAWILYTLIVLEILFMVSPFAAYYYSIYATPLNALQAWPQTAWLTMYLLPHFSYSSCVIANGLLLVSWPLMLVGILLFVVGFCQIYWAKFTGKGAVDGGLYRYIRHPQYLALAIVGLGASLYWSRFIVVLAFVCMLCLYHYLARLEERLCLAKFGEPYRQYLERTGMFLPKGVEAWWRALDWPSPERAGGRVMLRASACLVVLGLTTWAALQFRQHVIAGLQTDVNESRVIVFLAPVAPDTEAAVVRLLDSADLEAELVYVAPATWNVPELAMKRTVKAAPGGHFDELRYPSTHGNAIPYQGQQFNAMAVETLSLKQEQVGIERLSSALNMRPSELLELDLGRQEITARRPAGEGQWASIPVPTF